MSITIVCGDRVFFDLILEKNISKYKYEEVGFFNADKKGSVDLTQAFSFFSAYKMLVFKNINDNTTFQILKAKRNINKNILVWIDRNKLPKDMISHIDTYQAKLISPGYIEVGSKSKIKSAINIMLKFYECSLSDDTIDKMIEILPVKTYKKIQMYNLQRIKNEIEKISLFMKGNEHVNFDIINMIMVKSDNVVRNNIIELLNSISNKDIKNAFKFIDRMENKDVISFFKLLLSSLRSTSVIKNMYGYGMNDDVIINYIEDKPTFSKIDDENDNRYTSEITKNMSRAILYRKNNHVWKNNEEIINLCSDAIQNAYKSPLVLHKIILTTFCLESICCT